MCNVRFVFLATQNAYHVLDNYVSTVKNKYTELGCTFISYTCQLEKANLAWLQKSQNIRACSFFTFIWKTTTSNPNLMEQCFRETTSEDENKRTSSLSYLSPRHATHALKSNEKLREIETKQNNDFFCLKLKKLRIVLCRVFSQSTACLLSMI